MGKLRRYFFAGLLVLIPIVLTIYIIYQLFIGIDGLLSQHVSRLLFKVVGIDVGGRRVPGLGLVAVLLLIFLTGIIARNYFGNKLLGLGDQIVARIPIINRIYLTLKQISQAFFSEKSEVFKRAVLVEYPRKGIYSIGFITQDTKGVVQEVLSDDVVSIFLPTTPNPTSGYLLFVPKVDVKELNISVEEALKLVISGGSIVPRELQNYRTPMELPSGPSVGEQSDDSESRQQ